MRDRIAALMAFGSGVVLVIALAAPLVSLLLPGAGAVLYSALFGLCHQMADRSFHLFGHALGVCGRCLGLYVGIVGVWLTAHPRFASAPLRADPRSHDRTTVRGPAWLAQARAPLGAGRPSGDSVRAAVNAGGIALLLIAAGVAEYAIGRGSPALSTNFTRMLSGLALGTGCMLACRVRITRALGAFRHRSAAMDTHPPPAVW